MVTNLSSYPFTTCLFKMTEATASRRLSRITQTSSQYMYLLPPFLAGLLIPFGFAPFHLPGCAILGIALLFGLLLQQQPLQRAFYMGFVFGLGFLGLGVSWVYVSIHEYGHLNPIVAALITLLFIVYLAVFPGLVGVIYYKLSVRRPLIFCCFLFSALWCLGELLRATFLGGFPWLILGFGQIDTPLKYLLPILGLYGVSFFACLAATFLAASILTNSSKRYLWIIAFITVLLSPSILKQIEWATIDAAPKSVGIIQANLSMRDKWDEALFWQLLQRYQQGFEQLLAKDKLIVMPESAIPLPASYVTAFLDSIHSRAKQVGSSILLGIPQPTTIDETHYYNTMSTLGDAQGSYLKQHLVPFGEFIPQPLQRLIDWLAFPSANMSAGKSNQPLIRIQDHPIASLICYELAYPQLLRKQLPLAEWIVSISDDGWFGHSFAMYQQLQIAQAVSIQTARFQVVANNDGLSAIINTRGDVVASLPAFSAGILEANIYPATGSSPWVFFGDTPILLLCLLIVIWALMALKISFLTKARR